MAGEDPTNWFTAKDVLIAAGGFIMTLGGIIGRSQVKRIDAAHEKIDKLENSHIGRDEHVAAVAALRQELHEGFKSTHARQDQLMLYLLGDTDAPHYRYGPRNPDDNQDGE